MEDLNALKKFGQNFLLDEPAIQTILSVGTELAEKETCFAEIGIGLGALTYPLLSSGRKTYLFEIDNAFIEITKKEILPQFPNAHLIEGDIRETFPILFPLSVVVFGNLPYHLSSEILTKVISELPSWKGGVFLVQREFAERVCQEISSFSVFLSAYALPKIVRHVHKNCFYPIPKIHSSILRLSPLPENQTNPFRSETGRAIWSNLLRAVFWGKRKQIQVSLRESPFSADPRFQEVAFASLQKLGISGNKRPEELNQEQFLNLGQLLIDSLSNEWQI